MKLLTGLLVVVLVVLQYRLWFGEGSLRSLGLLQQELAAQQAVNEQLVERNRLLEVEILDLKNGLEAVEERARSELGMIGADETFYLIVD